MSVTNSVEFDAASIGRFRVLEQRGAGPDGIVYRAVDSRTDQIVELHKVGIAKARGDWPRRAAALRLVHLLEHHAQLEVLSLDLSADPPFVVMEALPEVSLADLAETTDVSVALDWAIELSLALAEAHRLNLAHGNLLPSTLWIDKQHHVRLDLTGLQTRMRRAGTDPLDEARFRAPENAELGSQHVLADVFGLAAIVQWLLHRSTGLSGMGTGPDLADRLAALLPPSSRCEAAALVRLLSEMLSADPLLRPDAGTLAAQLQLLRSPVAESDTQLLPRHHADSDEAAADMTDSPTAGMPCSPQTPLSLQSGSQLGRYRIAESLGQGGMGSVYKATDLGTGATVAIKVLHASIAGNLEFLRRFHKEARMLSAINNPYVANLLEANEDRGQNYIVLEYVAGTTLKQYLMARGRCDERTALAIMADVARALVDAHRCGIVHRDVKPGNIVLSHVEAAAEDEPAMRVKLLDFGIARQVDQSQSMAMTRLGAALGTPLYMAPEQCKGTEEVGPPTDVYAMGVTLFELLAGRPPFQDSDTMRLAAMHCFEEPPSLVKLNPAISQAAASLVAKALSKQPADRYASAADMLAHLERLLGGETLPIEAHPRLPAHRPQEIRQATFTWDLQSSAPALWAQVTNTDRLNEAAGLPAPVFETVRASGRVRRFANVRFCGLKIRWEEHPFEWIEGRKMGVLREFEGGPFKWFASSVELTPRSGGGTRLSHRVAFAPRNAVGKLLAAIEIKFKTLRMLDRIYRRIDAVLSAEPGAARAADPFKQPERLSAAVQSRWEQRSARLVECGVTPSVADRLVDFLATAPAQELARIRPAVIADRLQVDREEMISACLHGVHAGLLVMRWDILCPTCRVASDIKSTLREIERHGWCEACNLDFELNFSESVELVFAAHPEIRTTDTGTYCIGGPFHAPHVVAQVQLAPGERMELNLTLGEGEYCLRSPQLPYSVPLRCAGEVAPRRLEVTLTARRDTRAGGALRAGEQVIAIENRHEDLLLVRLERTVPRNDVVTAAHAASLALFRDLFPAEVLKSGELVNVQHVTLLAANLVGVDVLLGQVGDAQAYHQVQQRFNQADEQIRRNGGTTVKVSGESMLAAFDSVEDAVRAALALSAGETSDAAAIPHFALALHRGPCLVTTSNGRLDYFGAQVQAVGRLAQQAGAGELWVTESVGGDGMAAQLLQESGRRAELIQAPLASNGPQQFLQRFAPASQGAGNGLLGNV